MKLKTTLALVSTVGLLALSVVGISRGGVMSPHFLSMVTRTGSEAVPKNRITKDLESVDVIHHGRIVQITRSGERGATMPRGYNNVSRHCPPFCIQPIQVLPGVETIGELEVLGYLKRMSGGDDTVLVVDSRDPGWVARGTIPGAVHVPWTSIDTDVSGPFADSAETERLRHILVGLFGAIKTNQGWDFSKARTLVLFCNGIWCGQSSANIRTLAGLGYPVEKMKWYRGGMQNWVSVGLTTVGP